MTTISFANSLGITTNFTEIELISILGNLNSSNAYFTSGLNELVFIRISQGKLLLLDLNDNINRKLFEIYSFHYSVGNVFHLKLIHNDNALELNINDALISVGFSGTTPITTLESRYMKLYTDSNHMYLNTNDLVKNTGIFAYTPAELKTLVAGAGIVLSNDANNLTITASITSLANYYTRTEVDTLFNSYYNRTYLDAEFSTKADVANVYDKSVLYTQIETTNLLNNKQNTNNPTITGTVTHTHSSQPHYTFNTTTTNPLVPTEFLIDRTNLDASLSSAFGMGNLTRGFFVWVNGSDRLKSQRMGALIFQVLLLHL